MLVFRTHGFNRDQIGGTVQEPFESKRQKTYFRTCAHNEYSDQPSHSRSLFRIFIGRIFDSQGCNDFQVENEDTGQTARMKWIPRIYPKYWHMLHSFPHV